MLDIPRAGRFPPSLKDFLQHTPGVLLRPVPLALLQPVFSRIASHVAQSRPELFARLGAHAGKRFLIDPIDLPFVLEMIDGSVDGDTLFFSRALRVTGDTEAVVALRNALDDFEGSALESVVESFGPLTRPATLALSLWRTARRN